MDEYDEYQPVCFNGYYKLSLTIVAEIVLTCVNPITPIMEKEYKLCRKKTLNGGNDIWFEAADMTHILSIVLDIFKNCETLEKSKKYIEKKYGYKKELPCEIDKIISLIGKYTQEEISSKLEISQGQVSKIKQKYIGDKK